MLYFDFELCLDALFLGSFGFLEDVFMEYALDLPRYSRSGKRGFQVAPSCIRHIVYFLLCLLTWKVNSTGNFLFL